MLRKSQSKKEQKTKSSSQYSKHYATKEFNIESIKEDGQISSIKIDEKVMIRRRGTCNNTIYYFHCCNERKSNIKCPAQCRICLPINKDSKADIMKVHNQKCLKQSEDPEESGSQDQSNELSHQNKIEDLESSPTYAKDETQELIENEINLIVSQEPEITEKELRKRLEIKFGEKKLPNLKQLQTKINTLRNKLGVTSLDYVRKKKKN